MAKHNPTAGGPDFVELLKRALEGKSAGLVKPPATGGVQVSFRLEEGRLAMLDILSKRSGWNRTQVIDALIEHGLFELFERLPNSLSSEIIDETVKSVVRSRQ